jgi:hypothetical protein
MKQLFLLTLAAVAAGAQAATIYSNGPVINAAGLSVLTAPATTFGFGAQTGSGNAVADDFTVPAGQTWNITSLDLYAYQTGSTSFTFQTATWSLVSGDVNTGTVLASGSTAVTNGGRVGYRVSSTTPTDIQRGIYDNQVDIPDISLGAGSYWLRWSLTGSLASGPWQPPTADGRTGNAAQSITGGAFATLSDAGSLLSVELPFALQGTVTAVPESGTLALMLAGGLAVAAATRRRRAQ